MDGQGKRVSLVELYLDLVFVLAVGQLAHLIVAEPEMQSVWISLGLFFTLWWTWIGFAVLYNRQGADEPAQRLLFLIGSVPAGVAAVAIEPASTGDIGVFAPSLAAIRLVLAAAPCAGRPPRLLRERITRACLISAGLFLISVWTPGPFRYVLWAIAIGVESNAMLAEDREAARRMRRERDFSALQPSDPAEALDAHHFAERFGLFLIIMLGEVLVEAGQVARARRERLRLGGVAAAMVLGGGAVVAVLRLRRRHQPQGARARRRLDDDGAGDLRGRPHAPSLRATHHGGRRRPADRGGPAAIAYWLACIGVGMYLTGTRVFLMASSRVPGVVRRCCWSRRSSSAASITCCRRMSTCGCWPPG